MARAARKPANIPADETKRQKFARLVNPRLDNVYRGLISIGKLGAPAYERTDEDVKAIRAVLHREVDVACDKLQPRAGGTSGGRPSLGGLVKV